MKNKYILLIVLLFPVFFNCSGVNIRVFEKKDNLDRVSRIFYYEDNIVNKSEEIRYYGNSHNPSKIIYRIRRGDQMVPYKEEEYYFIDNNLTKLSFFVYLKGKRINTGMIKYYYRNNKQRRVEYYARDESFHKIMIFGLDQYEYSGGKPMARRIIEYEVNSKTGKPMQIGHFSLPIRMEK